MNYESSRIGCVAFIIGGLFALFFLLFVVWEYSFGCFSFICCVRIHFWLFFFYLLCENTVLAVFLLFVVWEYSFGCFASMFCAWDSIAAFYSLCVNQATAVFFICVVTIKCWLFFYYFCVVTIKCWLGPGISLDPCSSTQARPGDQEYYTFIILEVYY